MSDHCTSFKYEQYKNKSKLPSFIWETKNKGLNFEIKWSVVRRSTTYKAESKKCNLCLWENFHIMTGDKDTLLTERYELITKCKHIDKYLLKSYKSRRGRRRKGRVRGRWCFSSWYNLAFFLYDHVYPLITSNFIFRLVLSITVWRFERWNSE